MNSIEDKVAGVPGFEPRMAGSKPAALPLGYTPTLVAIAEHSADKSLSCQV